MNERIKELAEQATSIVESPPNREGYTSSYAYFDKEKFAELIIRECSDIACEYDAPKMSGPGMIIAGRIETYFGVEE